MVRIKVCGLTDPVEARRAAECGVDAIGLVFAKSPRQVDPETARRIVRAVPPLVQTVGVFVNESAERMQAIIAHCGLDLVQLHGREGPDVCEALAPRAVKAARVRRREDIEALSAYNGVARAFLLDAWSPDTHGGTGQTFDWSLIAEAGGALSEPIILAGGLNPENVAQAVQQVRPWGVDVSSGVEISPGRKDMDKVRRFVDAVRGKRADRCPP
jgi:phosphoribosylanthranilate isomerase